MALDIAEDLASVAFEPVSVEEFGDHTELDDEIAGEVLRLQLAAFFPPKPQERILIIAHDDPGVRAAYKASSRSVSCHRASPLFI